MKVSSTKLDQKGKIIQTVIILIPIKKEKEKK